MYEISEAGLRKLDANEGYPSNYDRIKLPVKLDDDTEEEAWVYIAQPNKVAEGLRPTREYLSHYLRGKDLLSAKYYEMFEKVETLADS